MAAPSPVSSSTGHSGQYVERKRKAPEPTNVVQERLQVQNLIGVVGGGIQVHRPLRPPPVQVVSVRNSYDSFSDSSGEDEMEVENERPTETVIREIDDRSFEVRQEKPSKSIRVVTNVGSGPAVFIPVVQGNVIINNNNNG